MAQSLRLFVNYRRDDNPYFVELIRTWLMIRYGRQNVFMDFDNLPSFVQFEDFIRQKIRESDAVICIIGPQWMELLDNRIQFEQKDYVRIELEEALRNKKPIAPICILGARVPSPSRVPPSIKPIFETWNVAYLRDGKEVIEKVHRLMDDLETNLGRRDALTGPALNPIEAALESRVVSSEGLNIYEAYGRMLTAFRGGEWDVAMAWIAALNESEQSLPNTILKEMQEVEQACRAALEELARREQRRQVADYLYGFVRTRFEAGFLDATLYNLLHEVWDVYADYDPDGIANQLPNHVKATRHPLRGSSIPQVGAVAERIEDRLQQAITTYKAGDRIAARDMLLGVVEADQRNERAWLWLAAVSMSEQERQVCLETALFINPHNHKAREALELLHQRRSSANGNKAAGLTQFLTDLSEVARLGKGVTAPLVVKPNGDMPTVPTHMPRPFEWCYVPGGEVRLAAGGYVPDGGRVFTIAPFFIAKYPITNAQFAAFVESEKGYRNPIWWHFSTSAKAWHAEHPTPMPTGFEGDLLPRTNVGWFEAMAFCRWLSAQSGDNITLPTEQQWQFAAQGPHALPYPWGDTEPTPERCNYDGIVGHPTPVTTYLHGASPFGVMDMAGNVWEWCITGWNHGDRTGRESDSRVLRGGSWFNSPDFTHLNVRNYLDPQFGLNFVGLRVVRMQAQHK